jgi:hypothetical protein
VFYFSSPDLPSNRSSLGGSNHTHSERGTRRVPHRYFLSLPPRIEIRVSCAPAAFLGSGSRFSGSLSGIEPRFPVTRYYHGGPLPHRRRLIGQKLVRRVAGAGPAIRRFAVVHPVSGTPVTRRSPGRFRFRRVRPSPRGFGPLARISPRITTVIRPNERRVDRNWFNEPFAVSAVHGRVLGLAWLSLGDEHTTTVRIKRVSLQTPAPAPLVRAHRNSRTMGGPGAGQAFFSRERAVFARDRGLLGSCPGPARTTVRFTHGLGLFLPRTGGLHPRPGPFRVVKRIALRGGRDSPFFSRERAVFARYRGLLGSCPGPARTTVRFTHGLGLFLPRTGGLRPRPGPFRVVKRIAIRGGRDSAFFSRERAVSPRTGAF